MDVRIVIGEPAETNSRLADLTDSLRDEVQQLDAAHVQWEATDAAPVGSRGPDLVSWTALIVAIPPALHVVQELVNTIRRWALGTGRKVRLEVRGDVLELDGTSADLQDRLVDEWVRLHSKD